MSKYGKQTCEFCRNEFERKHHHTVKYCSRECSGAAFSKEYRDGKHPPRGGGVRGVGVGLTEEERKQRTKKRKSEWHKKNREKKGDELRAKSKEWQEKNKKKIKVKRSAPEYKAQRAAREKILRSKRAYGEYGEAHRALIKLENQLKGQKDGTQC